MDRAKEKELSAGGGKKVKVKTALSNKNHPQHKQAKGIISRIKDRAKAMLSKAKKKKSEPKKQSKADANFYARQFGGKTEGFGGELKGSQKKKFERARKENAEQLGYKLTGKTDVNESVNERSNPSDKKELLRALKNSKVADAFSLNNDELVIEMTSPSGTNFVVGNIRKYKGD